MNSVQSGIVAIACAGLASVASAASVNLSFVNITNNGNTGIAPQLSVTVSDVAGAGNEHKVDVVFKNLVGIASSVKEVYFDAGALGSLVVSGSILSQSGSTFVFGSGNPSDLPGGGTMGDPFQTTLSLLADSGSGGPSTGLDTATDSLTIRLSLAGTNTYANIADAIQSVSLQPSSFRIGMHITSIGTMGGSDSYVSGPPSLLAVPLPGAAWAGLTGLGAVLGAAHLRRRGHRVG